VGRDETLSRLRRIAAVGGLEVIGEDGIGKTALMSHALPESPLERLVYVDWASPGAREARARPAELS
jgi:hypothetical protein